MRGYVEFDRFTDLEASLEQLLTQIQKEPMTAASWKWALISSHAALQGAVCIALRGNAGFDTWKPSHFRKWMAAYDRGDLLPDPQLDFFMELFDRLFGGSPEVDRNLIDWLNQTRNGLIHFNTDAYSIERASIVGAMNAAIAATIATPKRSKGVFFYCEERSERFFALCDRKRGRLQGLADA